MPFVPDKISSFVPDRPSSFIPDESQSIAVLDEQLKPIVKKTGEIFFNPLAKTLTGESLHDRAIRATEPSEIKPNDPISYWSAFPQRASAGMAGGGGGIISTPFNLIT